MQHRNACWIEADHYHLWKPYPATPISASDAPLTRRARRRFDFILCLFRLRPVQASVQDRYTVGVRFISGVHIVTEAAIQRYSTR